MTSASCPGSFCVTLLNILDLVAEHDDFDPMAVEGCEPKDPNDEEQRLRSGSVAYEADPEDAHGYEPVEF